MLPPRAQAYLYDLVKAARLLDEFTKGVSFAVYAEDALLRSGVER